MTDPGIDVVRAPAKLNLHLEIVGRRPDGYHELSTVMHAIDWVDDLTIDATPADATAITLACEPAVTADATENLAWRAADRLLREAGADPHHVAITLRKRIPGGGGLGGGSSDAACVLDQLNRRLGLGVDRERLTRVATSLGADVPFFLHGGTAFCEGIGDRVTPLRNAPRFRFVIVQPTFGCDTAHVYRGVHLDLTAPAALDSVAARSRLDADWSTTRPFNRLADTVFRLYPRLAAVRDWFEGKVGRPVQVTGSGSCLFALWSEGEALDVGAEDFADAPADVERVHFATSA